MSETLQEVLALATVVLVAGFALWRWHAKRRRRQETSRGGGPRVVAKVSPEDLRAELQRKRNERG